MNGWIKLWRKLISNGHFSLDSRAFKLWIYCLLEAAPYPDPVKGLAAGELWLSYRSIREKLTEGSKKLSMSTIAAVLKQLEAQGYLSLEHCKAAGTKVSILKWREHQSTGSEDASSPAVEALPAPMLLYVFESEFGRKLSPIEQGCLYEWENTYSPDLICEALTLGSYQNKRSMAYIGGILKKRRAEQLKTGFTKSKGIPKQEWYARR